ncbi:MAG: prealbumin-like fold domain-containing protein [Lachnospiraceae bacterium]|nr:prealbumin-like fold domain-containing protein [Lachnospiraceae bacterium]
MLTEKQRFSEEEMNRQKNVTMKRKVAERILAFAMVFVMTASMMPVTAGAEGTVSQNDTGLAVIPTDGQIDPAADQSGDGIAVDGSAAQGEDGGVKADIATDDKAEGGENIEGQKAADADLKKFIYDARLNGEGINIEDDGIWKTIKEGVNYKMSLSFHETDTNLQFVEDNTTMSYRLPDGVIALKGGKIDIVVNDGGVDYTVENNDFRVSEDGKTVSLTLNTADPDLARLNQSANAKFTLNFDANINLSDGEHTLDFGNNVKKKVLVDNTHNASVKKSHAYSYKEGLMYYTIEIKSTGVSKNIKISDTIENGSVLKILPNSISCEDSDVDFKVTKTTNTSFEGVISTLKNRTTTVTYLAEVDPSGVWTNGSLTAEGDALNIRAGKNTVTITADNDSNPNDNTATTYNRDMKITSIDDKKGENTKVEGGYAYIEWAIYANKECVIALNGKKVVDTLEDGQVYAGDGIKVRKTDASGKVVEEKDVAWGSGGLTNPGTSGKSFTYTFSDTTPYNYKISYRTKVPVAGKITDFEVNNKVDIGQMTKASKAKVNVPGEGKFDVKKTPVAVDKANNKISWDVAVHVPAGGLDELVVTDTLPNEWVDSVHLYEKMVGGAVVTGTLSSEAYTAVTDGKVLTVTFYKNAAKTQPGVAASTDGKGRTIHIKLETEINATWLQASNENNWLQSHKNGVEAKSGDVTVKDEAKAVVANPVVKKTADGGTKYVVDSQGNTVPYYKYNLVITPVNSDTIEIQEQLPAGFSFYDAQRGSEDASVYQAKVYGGDQYEQNSKPEKGNVTFDQQAQKIIVTVPKRSDGTYYSYYRISYCVIPTDGAAVKELNQKAIDAGGSVSLVNRATYNGISDDETVTYTAEGGTILWKSLTNERSLSGHNHNATYEIVLNEQGLRLNGGNPLIFTDTFENMSLNYITISFEPQSAVESYDVSGNVLTAVIKDGERVTIRYTSRVNGNEVVNFRNTATFGGQTHVVDKQKDFSLGSAGSGHADIPQINLLKYESGNMANRLANVEFKLFKATAVGANGVATAGTPVLDKNGKQVVVKTDSNGQASIRGNQSVDGWTLVEGQTYYVEEVAAPAGYEKENAKFSFTISTDGVSNYDKQIYYENDIVKIKNKKSISNAGLTVKKTLAGNLPANFDPYKVVISLKDADGKDVVDGSGKKVSISLGEIAANAAVGLTGYDYDATTKEYTWIYQGDYTGDVAVVEDYGTLPSGYSVTATYRTDATGNSYSAYPQGGVSTSIDGTAHTIELKNTYSRESGTLSITKSVIGPQGMGWDDVKDSLEFQVSANGQIAGFSTMTIKGNQAGWNPDGNGHYIYTISDIPVGSYTVTETKADVMGYVRTTNVNSVNTTLSGKPVSQNGDAASVRITQGVTENVEISNAYQEKTSLVITKTVVDNTTVGNTAIPDQDKVTWDQIKDRISFTVTGPDGSVRNIAGTDQGWDFDRATGAYFYTISDIPAGTYEITENNADLQYYSRVTTASGEGVTWGNAGSTTATGDSGFVAVSGATGKSIAITNTYTRQTGKLVLKKTIAAGSGATVTGVDTADHRKKIEFTVTDPYGNVKIYNLEDAANPGFVPDGANVYTLTIDPAVAGEYKVKETKYDIDAGNEASRQYAVQSVVYTVADTAAAPVTVVDGMSNGCDATVAANGTATVSVTDTYSSPAGRLTLKKRVTDDTGADLPISSLSELADQAGGKAGVLFTIYKKNGAGTFDVYRKVTALDSGWTKSGNEWIFVCDYMPVGTYYIAEGTDEDPGKDVASNYQHQGTTLLVTADAGSSVVYATTGGNAGKQQTNTASADFTFGDTASSVSENSITAAYANAYRRLGRLAIAKKVTDPSETTDAIPWDQVRSGLRFEILDGNGKTYAVVNGSDRDWRFDRVTGEHTYEIKGLPEGTYTVKEILDGSQTNLYTIDTQVNGLSNASRSGQVAFGSGVYDETIVFKNVYSPRLGDLVIEKTISGRQKPSWSEARSHLKFEITDPAGKKTTVEGSDSGWQLAGNGVYRYTLTGVPEGATYKVREIAENAGNFGISEVEYTITSQGTSQQTVTGDTASDIVVRKGEETVISFDNTYAMGVGSILLQKTVAGGRNFEQVKDQLSFNVLDANDQVIKTITGDQLQPSDSVAGVYAYTIYGLTIGETYYVEETATGEDARFTRKTVYSATGSADSDTRATVAIAADGRAMQVAVTNTYVRKEGYLTVTKHISGDITAEEAEGALRFEIRDETGSLAEQGKAYYTLKNDFTKGADGVYTLKKKLPTGNYTVKETLYDVNGYALKSITYQVKKDTDTAATTVDDGKANGAVAQVEEEKNTTVAIDDVYTRDMGTLKITKTIKGDVTKEEAEGALQFKVSSIDKDGKVVGTPDVYTLKQFTYDAATGKYVLTLPVPTGSYRIEESIYDIDGYAVAVKVTDVSGKSAEGTRTDREIKKGQTAEAEFEDTYTAKPGKLLITKTIKGDVTKEEAEGALKFKVTNKDTGKSKTYTLKDFKYDKKKKIYTLSLNDVSRGGYEVEETISNIKGYEKASVTYTVGGDSKKKGKKAAVTVESGKTAKVAFTNTYEKQKGKLVITKTLAGDATKGEAEKALKFKVTEKKSGKSKTYTLADFEYDGDAKKYTLTLKKEEGGYIVEEAVSDIKGYRTESVTYSVGDGAATGGKSAEVTVATGKNVKVNFTDTYRKNTTTAGESKSDSKTTSAANAAAKTEAKKASRTPKTGDFTPILLYIMLLIAGMAGMAVCIASVFAGKKQEPEVIWVRDEESNRI